MTDEDRCCDVDSDGGSDSIMCKIEEVVLHAKDYHGNDIGQEHQQIEAPINTEEGPAEVADNSAVSFVRQ